MSIHRWAATTAVMAAAAWALSALGPGLAEGLATLAAPQRAVNTGGADALLVVGCSALAWLVWAWGALGLLLTGLSALPGLPGRAAAVLVGVLLPEGARRLAAVAVGVGLTAAPVLAFVPSGPGATPPLLTAASATPLVDWPAQQSSQLAAPDWPGSASAPASPRPATSAAPDWPATAAVDGPGHAGAHLVVPGDCLWDVARAWLEGRSSGPVSDAEVAAATDDWWRANAAVIGPDPDLIRPGQLLRPPA